MYEILRRPVSQMTNVTAGLIESSSSDWQMTLHDNAAAVVSTNVKSALLDSFNVTNGLSSHHS